jgi:hypothetical protein
MYEGLQDERSQPVRTDQRAQPAEESRRRIDCAPRNEADGPSAPATGRGRGTPERRASPDGHKAGGR